MKTLLYNPIFINPWAYIVFPNLGGNLKQEIDSVVEPAIFDGKIEVKTIANGDINLVRYYSNCMASKNSKNMKYIVFPSENLNAIARKKISRVYNSQIDSK